MRREGLPPHRLQPPCFQQRLRLRQNPSFLATSRHPLTRPHQCRLHQVWTAHPKVANRLFRNTGNKRRKPNYSPTSKENKNLAPPDKLPRVSDSPSAPLFLRSSSQSSLSSQRRRLLGIRIWKASGGVGAKRSTPGSTLSQLPRRKPPSLTKLLLVRETNTNCPWRNRFLTPPPTPLRSRSFR